MLGGVTDRRFHDIACGVRVIRRPVAEALPLYGDLHRFIPALALREGYRVDEVPVPQHPNDARTRIYGPGVYLRRLLDVAAFFFLAKFTEKPLRFFGLVGTVFFALGAVISLVLLVERFAGQGIANRPLLLLAVLLIALGVQLMGLGPRGRDHRPSALAAPAGVPRPRAGLSLGSPAAARRSECRAASWSRGAGRQVRMKRDLGRPRGHGARPGRGGRRNPRRVHRVGRDAPRAPGRH